MNEKNIESTPVMPDVRHAQLEARRIMAISRWPVMLVVTLAQCLLGIALLGGLSKHNAGYAMILFNVLLLILLFSAKKIIRAGVGAKAPLVLSSAFTFSNPRHRIIVILGLAAGFIAGIAKLTIARPASYGGTFLILVWIFFVVYISLFVFYGWIRTRLWELGFLALWLAFIPLYGWHMRGTTLERTSVAIITLLLFGILPCLFVTISFFIRWRRWLRSLPENVKAGEE